MSYIEIFLSPVRSILYYIHRASLAGLFDSFTPTVLSASLLVWGSVSSGTWLYLLLLHFPHLLRFGCAKGLRLGASPGLVDYVGSPFGYHSFLIRNRSWSPSMLLDLIQANRPRQPSIQPLYITSEGCPQRSPLLPSPKHCLSFGQHRDNLMCSCFWCLVSPSPPNKDGCKSEALVPINIWVSCFFFWKQSFHKYDTTVMAVQAKVESGHLSIVAWSIPFCDPV